jgi:hypothetical protein
MTDATPPTLQRLEDQISWYDRKSQNAQSWFKALKIVQLVAAGMIPLTVVFGIPGPEKVTTVLALLVLVVEGLQQLNQYQSNWISYRSTCEALRHEKYLFLAGAGPYAKAEQDLPLLADRIEGLISQEHAKWLSARQQADKSTDKDTAHSSS